MVLHAKALAYPVIIGVIALALIYVFFSLTGSVAVKDYAMFNRLHELKDYSFDRYLGGWDIFVLDLFTSAIILFAGGFIAGTVARPGNASVAEWLKAPLAAACVPALAINVYLLITWYNDVQLFNSTGIKDGRPFEPMILPVTLLFLVLITVFCIGFSLAGGLLAQAALKPKADDRGSK